MPRNCYACEGGGWIAATLAGIATRCPTCHAAPRPRAGTLPRLPHDITRRRRLTMIRARSRQQRSLPARILWRFEP